MKNSKEYSQELQKLYRLLKRKYSKPQKVFYDEPLEAVVYAIVSENMSETEAQSAIKRFGDNFVDLNDLRVSLAEEVVETLGANTAVTIDTASMLTRVLYAVFNKYNAVSLKGLKKMGKRPARQALDEIDGTSRFVVDYCMLTSLQGHAIPLTKKMIEYLRNSELVYPEADEGEIKGFLARQISVTNAYEFYALLRRQSESRRTGAKKKTTRKTRTTVKAKTKTKKKTKKVEKETGKS